MADSELSVKVVADVGEIKKSLEDIAKETGKMKEVAGVNIDNTVGKLFVLNQGFETVATVSKKVKDVLLGVTLDMILLGEQAVKVENGFRALANGAGLAGDKLLEAIKKANNGSMQTTELIQKSSELVASLGSGAQRIPELLDMAKKAASNLGLSVNDVFEGMSNAVRNGNTAHLKHYGLLIDSEQAIKNYARQSGIAASTLSEAGRAQVLLNAVLEAGSNKFKEVSTNGESTGGNIKKLKNAFRDLEEQVGKILDGVLGSYFVTTLKKATEAAKGLGTILEASFGTGAKAQEASIQLINNRIETLNEKLAGMTSGKQGFFDRLIWGNNENAKKQVIDEINQLQGKLKELESKRAMAPGAEQYGPPLPEAAGTAAPAKRIQQDSIDKNKLIQQEAKFNQEITNLRLKSYEDSLRLSTNLAEFNEAYANRRVELEMQLSNRFKEIDISDQYSAIQKIQLKEQAEIEYDNKIRELHQNRENETIAMYQREAMYAEEFLDRLSAGFAAQNMEAQRNLRNGATAANIAAGSIASNMSRAMQSFAKGQVSAGEAMKMAFFGALSDMAIRYGEFMLLASLFPPNPVGIAGGLGLIALGGLLSTLAGGAGGGGTAGGGSPGMGSESLGGPGTSDALRDRRKEVSINIEGNYFESEQTKLAIVEAVRSSQDASDFVISRGNRG